MACQFELHSGTRRAIPITGSQLPSSLVRTETLGLTALDFGASRAIFLLDLEDSLPDFLRFFVSGSMIYCVVVVLDVLVCSLSLNNFFGMSVFLIFRSRLIRFTPPSNA